MVYGSAHEVNSGAGDSAPELKAWCWASRPGKAGNSDGLDVEDRLGKAATKAGEMMRM